MLIGQLVKFAQYLAYCHHRVPAQRHGRWPGVGLLAANFNAVTAHMLYTGDHSYLEIFRLEYGALFNMQFEGGVHRLAGKVRAELPNTLQFTLYASTLQILELVGLCQRHGARPDRGAHHGSVEARALFIGPDHNFNRMVGKRFEYYRRTNQLNAEEIRSLDVSE